MAAIGFVLHHERTQAADLAREAAAWLQDEGHEVRIPRPDADIAGLASLGCDEGALGDGLDLAVSLGGDGTMLRTVDLVAGTGCRSSASTSARWATSPTSSRRARGRRSSGSSPESARSRSACC